MGAFNSKSLNICCKNLTKEIDKQFCECYGINYDEYGCIKEKLEKEELDNLYAILSIAFGNTVLLYEESEGHTVSDWYSGYAVSYNNDNSGIIETKSYDYCYGEFLANNVHAWDLLKKEIEEKAKEKGIKVEWDENYEHLWPAGEEGDEFYDFCDKILEKHGGLEGLATTRKTAKIKTIKVNQQKVKEIIKLAKSNDYSKLVDALENKLDSNGIYPDFIFEPTKKEKTTIMVEDINNIDSIIDSINNNKKIDFKKLDENFRNNKELVIKILEANPDLVGKDILKNTSDRLKDDEDVVFFAIMNHTTGFQYASNRLKNDKKFINETIKKIDSYLKNKYKDTKTIDPEFIEYTENLIVSNIIKNASENIKNDKDVLLNALNITSEVFASAGKELKNDRDFIIEAIKIDPFIYYYVGAKLKNDKELAMMVINKQAKNYYWLYNSLGDKIKNDGEIIYEMVKNDGHILENLSPRYQKDPSLISLAINSGFPLSIASDEIMNNKEVVLKSLGNYCGRDLEYVSEKLKDDKDVVIKAVQNDYENGEAFQYASDRLKDDKEVVLEAVKVSHYALKYASDRLKNDKDVVITALKKDKGYNKYYIGASLKEDPEIKKMLEEE